MTEPVARLIDRLIGNLEALHHEIATAETLLCERRARIDAWPPGGDNPKVAGGDSTSLPEAAMIARISIDETLDSHRDELNAATLIIRNLRRDCQATNRREGRAFRVELPSTPRCNATGRDGYLEPRPPQGDGWSDLNCTNIPTRGPLCDSCAKREYRWRQRHGLPPRRDGLYAGDLDERRLA